MTNDKWFNKKDGEQAFPSLAVTTEESREAIGWPIYRYSTTSHLDPNDWAELLNDDFFIWRERLADGWPHPGSCWRRRETSDAQDRWP